VLAGVVVAVLVAVVPDDDDEQIDVGTDDDLEDALSIGNDSPGLKAIVAFLAYAFWISSVCVSFYIGISSYYRVKGEKYLQH